MNISKTLVPFFCLLLFGLALPVHAEEADSLNGDPASFPASGQEERSFDSDLSDEEHALLETGSAADANEQTIFRFLKSELQLNTAAACGVLANLADESGYDPAHYNGYDTGGTSSYGIAQWNSGYSGGRQAVLRSWCAQNGLDSASLYGQLRFLQHELQTVPAYQYSVLQNNIPNTAAGAASAALNFAMNYEGVTPVRYGPRESIASGTLWPRYCNAESEPPVLQTLQSTKIDGGYYLRVSATDASGIASVQFAAWSENNGQDDLPADWKTNPACAGKALGNGQYEFSLLRSAHNNDTGLYQVHIYAYDIYGNEAMISFPALDLSTCPNFSGKTETIKEADCLHEGLKRVYCADGCGKYQEEAIPALGHAFSEWTETAPGSKKETRTCSRCQLKETRDMPEYEEMLRLYNPNNGEHFYTKSEHELKTLVAAGWQQEGVGWKAPYKKGSPVYRLYNPNVGDHHYTTSKHEKDQLAAAGWHDEGIGWNSADAGDPVFRQYNLNAKTGTHNFTTSEHEKNTLVSQGWHDEGVAWYAWKKVSIQYLTG